jgi:hypothetical protein
MLGAQFADEEAVGLLQVRAEVSLRAERLLTPAVAVTAATHAQYQLSTV